MISAQYNDPELTMPPFNIASLLEKLILGGIIFIIALPLLGDYGLWLFPIGRDIIFKLSVEFLWLLFFLKIILEKFQCPSLREVWQSETMPNAQSSLKSRCPDLFSSLVNWDFIGHWSLGLGHLKTPITLSLIAFWLIMILATLTSIQPEFSLFGNIYKNQGLMTWTHYILFFFLLIVFCKDKKYWQFLINIAIGVASAVSLIALWQMIQHDFVFRASATLNNSNYLGAYLILLLPVTFAHFLAKRSWLLGFATALQFLAILFTQTRGAYLGLIATTLIFIALSLNSLKLRRFFGAAELIFIVITLFSLLIFTPPGQIFQRQFPNFTNRFLNLQNIKGDIVPRLEAWRAGWQGMFEKPLLGYGPENFFVAYDKYYTGTLDNELTPIELSPWEAWFDKAHNFIFDIGATTGFLGLLAYISIFLSAIFMLLKKLRIINYGFRMMDIGLIAAFTGYLAQNLLGFDTTVPGIYLVFLLAYSHSITSPETFGALEISNFKKTILTFRFWLSAEAFAKAGAWFGIWILAFGFFIASLKIHANILRANHQLNLAETLAHSGQIEQGFAAFEKGLEYNASPINPNLRRRYAVIALAYYDVVEKNCKVDERTPPLTKGGRGGVSHDKCDWLYNDSKKYLARALELQTENAAKEWPHFTRNYIYAAQIAHILGDYKTSDAFFAKAIDLSPGRSSIRSKWNELRESRKQ